jgi:hypothetical protein
MELGFGSRQRDLEAFNLGVDLSVGDVAPWRGEGGASQNKSGAARDMRRDP